MRREQDFLYIIGVLIAALTLTCCIPPVKQVEPHPSPIWKAIPANPLTPISPFISPKDEEWPFFPGELEAIRTPQPFPQLSVECYAGEKVASSNHFDFYVEEGHFFYESLDEIVEKMEEVYTYVSLRLDASLKTRVNISFQSSPPTTYPYPVRAISFSKPAPCILLYADKEQIWAIAAHEIAHQIHFQNFGSIGCIPVENFVLLEGLATWAAGRYYYEWKKISSFDQAVIDYLENSQFIPFAQYFSKPYQYQSEEMKDRIYIEAASFIDFLTKTYCMDRLKKLLGAKSPMKVIILGIETWHWKADYEFVYGKSFQELEREWLQYLADKSRFVA